MGAGNPKGFRSEGHLSQDFECRLQIKMADALFEHQPFYIDSVAARH